MIWTHKQIEEALSLKITNNGSKNIGRIQFNSNDIKKEDIFIALTIGKRDGHNFVNDAINNGASFAIVNKVIQGVNPKKLIIVKDTLIALDLLARYKRNKSNAVFIAITGSVGKTSLKEALGKMLKAYSTRVFYTIKNFNNSIGIRLNLSSMPDDTEYAIIEMGMSKTGELSDLTKLVLPDIAVINSVAQGHLQFFSSVEEISDAKCEIFNNYNSSNMIALINYGIPTYSRCINNISNAGVNNIKTFGEAKIVDSRLLAYINIEYKKTKLIYLVSRQAIQIEISDFIAKHVALNFAAAFMVIKLLNFPLYKAQRAILDYKIPAGRGNIVNTICNNKKYTIICDYYNSNPESLKVSLQYIQQFVHKKKILILGDMLELGKDEIAIHKSLLPNIVDTKSYKVLLVGSIIKNLCSIMPPSIFVMSYNNVDDLISDIDNILHGNELILVKGSRLIYLEKVVQYLGVKENVL